MKIALSLSGGGYRATVFHLGALARLAESNRLEEVTFISTVSGGSLCTALVHALNDFKWAGSADYLDRILPHARQIITTTSLQSSLIWRILRAPFEIFQTKADDLSALMRTEWGLTAKLSELPETPRWMINATCSESGKNWRFERFRMGDYIFGYTNNTDIPLSDAVAASAGFPGLIGPLVLDTRRFSWFRYKDRGGRARVAAESQEEKARKTESIQPPFPQVHLWDGGVYDNHGLEGLHDFLTGWRPDVDFFIVSDGAGRSKPETYRAGTKALMRIITGIMMDQIRSLRSRAILERFINHHDRGGFLQIGNTCREVLRDAGKPEQEIERLAAGCLSREDAQFAAEFPTVIRSLTQEEFERLFRHGFEVADYTLFAYNPDLFEYIGYGNTRWA